MDFENSLLTKEDCFKILESTGRRNAILVDYLISRTSSDTIGYLGDYFQLKLCFKIGNRLEEDIFFVKTEPVFNQKQKEFVQECGIFGKEAFIYENIFPELLKGTVLMQFAPRCLLAKEGILVLEDLKRKNFRIVRRNYTLDECKVLIKTLAHLHAASIIYEEKRKKFERDFSLGKYLEKLPEGTFSFDQENPRFKWLKCVTTSLVDLIRKQSFYEQKMETKLFEIIYGGTMKEYIEPSKKFRNVLTHSDLWSSNIFLHEEGKCSFVDFQLMRYTPPAYDVMMALYLNTSTDLLHENLRFLLRFYYDTLAEIMSDHDLQAEVVFPSNEFFESIKIYEVPALIEASMFALTVFLPDDKSAYIRGDPERYESYTFVSRTPHVMDALKTNEKYREKILSLLFNMVSVIQQT